MELHRHHSKLSHGAAHTQHGGALAIRMLTFMTMSALLQPHVSLNNHHYDISKWARPSQGCWHLHLHILLQMPACSAYQWTSCKASPSTSGLTSGLAVPVKPVAC